MLLGVVEGFYNRPWNEDQRVDLFKKLSSYGCNAYLYAPKDDARHRTHWRDPEDLSGLQTLLDAARREGCTEDLDVLKAKLDRLREIGCNGFALLWDDIDTNLPEKDKEVFSSIGHAHACVSNEIFNHVSSEDVEFLMCPMEYCSSRADPDVPNSYYLLTLGELLHPDIGVFWTGSCVVSECITLDEIRSIAEVLRRKPVIWDNLHANDYDGQRIFMGPYYGRDPEIIPHIRGVLTNPNCEYSSNVPALYTLSKWASLGDKYDPFMVAEECQEEVIKELYRPIICFHKKPGASMDETDEDVDTNIQTSFIDDWIARAYTFNDVCRSFSGLFEKLPFIPNRDFFFDINPYLNSVHIALMACNRYLKWVGLDQCAKPLNRGPTLSGLPGDSVLIDALIHSKESVFTYGALIDSRPMGLIFASNRINSFKEGLKCDNAFSDFPNNGSIIGLVVENQLLFTKSMDLMLEVVSEWVESLKDSNTSQFSIIPRYSVLTKHYLLKKDFRPLDDNDKSNSKYIILKKGSFNALVNYTNRNANSHVSPKQLVTAYILATTCALGTAVGLNKHFGSRSSPIFKRLVPFVAVASSNFVNIPLMRFVELTEGIDLKESETGVNVCKSKAAAALGISCVVLSRITIAAPGMIFLPFVMERMEKKEWFLKRKFLHIPFQGFGIGLILCVMVPFGCALFPQTITISKNTLEKYDPTAYKSIKDTNINQLEFNKGL
ncbi:NCOAT [Lepeophtheirus salmonis]|uniref:NCOAT n=1 Tax=Lepeophtheirus salmonis TaxID=72036 RepID=A0A7R8H4S1_LEPSM|nr:NCOAT [Lepeophtheirus salmonis]CAF2864903.1 NCOAT [Lepeophtheirus salmonis]